MGPAQDARPSIQVQPQLQQVGDAAKADRIGAIQSRLSDETRDLLLRFGKRRAFSSGGFTAPGTMRAMTLENFGGNL